MTSVQSNESDEYLTIKPVTTSRNESLAGVVFVDDEEEDDPEPRLSGVVAEKRGTASTTETNATAPERLHQMEQDVLAKQQGRHPSYEPARVEQRVSTSRSFSKVRYAKSPSTRVKRANTPEKPRSDKENNDATRHPSGLQGLEDAIQDKIRQSISQTSLKERKVSHKNKSGDAIARLDERIAAQTGAVSLATPRLEIAKTLPAAEEKRPEDGLLAKPVKNDKDDALQNSGLQNGLSESHGGGLLVDDEDLEYGVLDGQNDNGLVVAFAVDGEGEDMYIPSAVEFDPDAKPSIYRNRRFRLYAGLAMIVVIVGTIAASVGITLTKSDAEVEPEADVPYRATLGIRESVERIVGSEKLDDINSPYRKALDWIQNVDPLQPLPESPTFTQRYTAAYFYFATSVKKPWSDGCSPATNGEPDECVYKRLISVDPVEYAEMPWTRWLSVKSECVWAGVFCDESGQIRALEFSTLIRLCHPFTKNQTI